MIIIFFFFKFLVSTRIAAYIITNYNEFNPFLSIAVHCISQFGNDFRPDYKFLGTLKTMFPDVPILGVTATATTKVIVDIQKMLNVQPVILKAEFNRPNLYYHVCQLCQNCSKYCSISVIYYFHSDFR